MIRPALALLASLVMASCGKSDDKGGFTEYQLKSKSSEARVHVQAIARGAAAYYDSEQMGASAMELLPRQLPGPAVGPTPALGTCCKQGGTCAPSAEAWSEPTWLALFFSVDDPHYYSYSYEVAPDGKSFTARAFGDLDCDGKYSTFEIAGKVADGDAVELGPLAIHDALE